MKIYQVEISNYCNLECVYCPHPTQSREKGLMSFSTFKDVVKLIKKCRQSEVYLHNFGEPLLHPDITKFISYAIQNDIEPSFFSNGVLITEKSARELYEAGLRKICISEHTKGEIDRVERLFKDNEIPIEIIDKFKRTDKRHNWAKQTNTRSTEKEVMPVTEPCIFERENAFVILWDGRINTCCIDVNGSGATKTVKNLLEENEYIFKSIKLCSSCNLMRANEKL